jgi:hypothetical protein
MDSANIAAKAAVIVALDTPIPPQITGISRRSTGSVKARFPSQPVNETKVSGLRLAGEQWRPGIVLKG